MNTASALERRRIARRVVVAYVAGAAVWIFGSDLLLIPLLAGTELLAAASIIKGITFVGVTGVMLYLILSRAPAFAFAPGAALRYSSRNAAWRGSPLPWFLVLAVALMGVVLWLFLQQGDQYRSQALIQVGARAELKALEVGTWLKQRAETALAYRRARFLQDDLPGALHGDPAARARIETRLEEIRRVHNHGSILLLDAEGQVLAAVGTPTTMSPDMALEASEVSRTLKEHLHVLRRTGAGPPSSIVMDEIVPVELGAAASNAPAVLLSRDTVENALFPILRRWPIPSGSAEAYLIRRRDTRVEYLSELRGNPAAALSPGPLLADPYRVGAQMARGQSGAIEAIDYRGVAVIAASQAVPGTDWRLVAKIDLDEVLDPARVEAWQFVPVILGLILLAALGASMLWRQQIQLVGLRESVLTEEREALAGHLDLLSRFANDIILLIDNEGDIVAANEKACTRYGYSREEMIGLPVDQLRAAGAPASMSHRLSEIELDGGKIFESLHVTRSGEEFPVEVSGRRISVDGAFYVQAIIRDISERRKSEEVLHRSEERFRRYFELGLIGMAISSPDKGLLEVNGEFCKILGYSHNELMQLDWATLTHPDDLAADLAQFERVMAGEIDAYTLDKRWIRKDGRVIDSTISVNCLRGPDGSVDYFVALLQDITERKLAENDLRESEERFRALIEQSISGACIIDREGRFVYVNPRLAAILGYESSEALVARTVLEVVAPEHHELVRRNMRERIAGEPQRERYHFDAIRKDGSRVTLGAHGNAGTFLGKPVIITTVQDVTELRRAELDVERTIAKLKLTVKSTIEVISTIGEMRDPYTHGHERRVGEIAVAIGAEMLLDADFLEGLRVTGYLHDVGKIAVPAEILSKPSRLSKAEFDLVKQHAQQSYDILKPFDFPWPVADAARQHHERMDGSGYPQGLKGDEIILEARILAVADTVEAMASHRPYRPGLGIDKAVAEIERGRGTAYDPLVVDACLRLFREKKYELPA